jgi:glyoxylase-like metal-dependent hydrolase (beta-lactamase superfamily II)
MVLKEEDSFELIGEGESVLWRVIETHGHCPGHICLSGDAGIISGDNVTVIGTILVPSSDGDMNQYLDGLEKIKSLNPPLLFPGHGPLSANPQRLLSRYIRHRRERHQAVYDAVKDNYTELEFIAKKAYEDTPEAHPMLLIDQTLSHLEGHIKSGKIRKENDKYFLNGY